MLTTLCATGIVTGACALEPIKLNAPDLERGETLMKSLDERQSIREYSDEEISLQDLSDLLWAANGINRPDGRRTAPSAMNRQPVHIYVADSHGVYVYDHKEHALTPVSEGDYRQRVRGNMPAMNLVLVVEDGSDKFAGVNVGYVSQNICLACTALGMATVPCGGMDEKAFSEACRLSRKQQPIIHHPVGYPVK